MSRPFCRSSRFVRNKSDYPFSAGLPLRPFPKRIVRLTRLGSLWPARGQLKQAGRSHPEHFGESSDHSYGRIVLGSFQGAHVGTIDLRAMRQFLLGQASFLPYSPEISSDNLRHVMHAPDTIPLRCLPPRSKHLIRHRLDRGPVMRTARFHSGLAGFDGFPGWLRRIPDDGRRTH